MYVYRKKEGIYGYYYTNMYQWEFVLAIYVYEYGIYKVFPRISYRRRRRVAK